MHPLEVVVVGARSLTKGLATFGDSNIPGDDSNQATMRRTGLVGILSAWSALVPLRIPVPLTREEMGSRNDVRNKTMKSWLASIMFGQLGKKQRSAGWEATRSTPNQVCQEHQRVGSILADSFFPAISHTFSFFRSTKSGIIFPITIH